MRIATVNPAQATASGSILVSSVSSAFSIKLSLNASNCSHCLGFGLYALRAIINNNQQSDRYLSGFCDQQHQQPAYFPCKYLCSLFHCLACVIIKILWVRSSGLLQSFSSHPLSLSPLFSFSSLSSSSTEICRLACDSRVDWFFPSLWLRPRSLVYQPVFPFLPYFRSFPPNTSPPFSFCFHFRFAIISPHFFFYRKAVSSSTKIIYFVEFRKTVFSPKLVLVFPSLCTIISHNLSCFVLKLASSH